MTISIETPDRFSESEESPYSFTPHLFISGTLRDQRPRSRDVAAGMLVDAFGLDLFDANTIALAAADIGQIKDAIKRVRIRRYGAIEIRFIELDIVTWHIVPSPENVRFEDRRVRSSDAAPRYGSVDNGSPVLALEIPSEQQFVTRLDSEVANIWDTNDHSKSIPARGIENPGLLSLARVTSVEHGTVGVLDATDGFGRTVGAHKALGIEAAQVLWEFSSPDRDQELRRELIALRDNPHDASDTVGTHLEEEDRERLRGSVMLRAQVIVGYSSSQTTADAAALKFDQVRRKLVGHIHIEPAKPFSLGTQYALKATAAIEALEASGDIPSVAGFSATEVVSVYWADSSLIAAVDTTMPDGRKALLPDEVFVLALAALRATSGRNDRKARISNAAIRDLTGQTPSRSDRLMLAADLSLRLGELVSGTKADDPTYEPRRSALDRSIRPKLFDVVSLSREPIADLLALALLELSESAQDSVEDAARPHTSALASLALFHLLGKPGRRLLERATRRDVATNSYISEPNVVVEGLVATEHGLIQLAQVVVDGRRGRIPQKVESGSDLVDAVIQGGTLLDATELRTLAGDLATPGPLPESPQAQVNAQIAQLKQEIRNVADRVESIATLSSGEDGVTEPLVLVRGAAVDDEVKLLQDSTFSLQTWSRALATQRATARRQALASDLDALDEILD
jgi:hypothetical protein